MRIGKILDLTICPATQYFRCELIDKIALLHLPLELVSKDLIEPSGAERRKRYWRESSRGNHVDVGN